MARYEGRQITDRRVFDQLAQREHIERGGYVSWGVASGLYIEPILLSAPRGTIPITQQDVDRVFLTRERESVNLNGELKGAELAIDAQIGELLQSQDRVIALDFSGGLGLSWMKIAKKREPEIKAGKLVMVVSNIGTVPKAEDLEGIMRRELRSYPNLYTDDDFQFVRDNYRLLHYVQGDAHELTSDRPQFILNVPTIADPRQTESVPFLTGQVSIVHTKGAIYFSHVPEEVLQDLASLLDQRGVLLTDNIYEQTYDLAPSIPHEAPSSSAIDRLEYRQVWIEALQQGYQTLVNQGLQNWSVPRENYRYQIFARPGVTRPSWLQS